MDIAIPFVILSYGNFAVFKRLFSYERNGVHVLPVFTDLAIATAFAGDMMTLMKKEFDDRRDLSPNICADKEKALEMFETIMVHIDDLSQIIVNPIVETKNDESFDTLKHTRIIENTHDIVDVVEWLHSLVDPDGGDGEEASSKIE